MAKSDNFALVETAGFALGAFNKYVDKMRGEGVKNICFCPRLEYKNCPLTGGRGVKKCHNSVHVVIECPHMQKYKYLL